jgi:hypothetical protein
MLRPYANLLSIIFPAFRGAIILITQMKQRASLFAHHENGIAEKHFPVFPEIPEQGIIGKIYNGPFPFFFHTEKQAVVECPVSSEACETLNRFYTFFKVRHVPAAR